MSERALGKCECEHAHHFVNAPVPRQSTSLGGHSYLSTLFVRPVTTTYGTFNVCRVCEETCLAAYILKERI